MVGGEASSIVRRSMSHVLLLLIDGRNFTPRGSAHRRTWTRPSDMGMEGMNKDPKDVRHITFRLSLGSVAFF